MLVNYKKLNTLSFGDVMLIPGVNRLDAATAAKLKAAVGDPEKGKKPAYPKLAQLVESGDLDFVYEPETLVDEETGEELPLEDVEDVYELEGMKAGQAVGLVKETVDYALLTDWLAKEEAGPKRASVVKALKAQLEQLAKVGMSDAETVAQNKKDGITE